MRPQHCNDCKKSLTFTAEQRAEIEKARKNGQYVMVLCEDCKRILAVKSVLGMALGR